MNYETMTMEDALAGIESHGAAGDVDQMHVAFRSALAAFSRQRMGDALKIALLRDENPEEIYASLDQAMMIQLESLSEALAGAPSDFRHASAEVVVDAGQAEVARLLLSLQDGGRA